MGGRGPMNAVRRSVLAAAAAAWSCGLAAVGRIRVLEDADGDGRYEQATLFADGLNFPNGCLTWRDAAGPA